MEELIKSLTETFGPSGEEETVRTMIADLVRDRTDRLFEDSLGNLYAVKEGDRPRIMISAHMDEIGVMVTSIDENGFLRLAPLGRVNPVMLLGQRIRFKNGLTGSVYHEKLKDLKELDWDKLYADVGQKDAASAEGAVKIGDQACLAQPFNSLPGSRCLAKAMDDRAGCAVLIETLRRLPARLPQEACFVFSIQEELGLRGAKTAAYRYEPDFGIAVDVTLVGDTPKASTMAVSLGKGPTIKVKDSSILCHPRVRQLMVETAKKNDIPYQMEVLERGGTDAGAIHLSREGVPSGAISIPCRYVHSPSEMIDLKDAANAVEVLVKLLTKEWSFSEESNVF
ncbi:MAG: M42 family metallopeptidase [Bacillota bacterium]|nr:M42 family metallopeptidase [Bacillota bacterium]